jgi:CHAD domain-containing protein
MSYRLRPNRSVRHELERIAVKQLSTAAGLLEHTGPGKEHDKAVHEARKSVKKTRAVLQLLRPDLDVAYSREKRLLQKIGHALSIERDADAIVETFDHLRAKYRSRLRGSNFTGIRQLLAGAATDAKDRAQRAGASERAARQLRRAERRAEAWRLRGGAFATIQPQLKKAFRRARKALARASDNPTAGNFHGWRKRIKVHRYHMRLLEDTRPAAMREYGAVLHKLEKWLGEEHNLVVLRRRLTSIDAIRAMHRERKALEIRMERFQAELRRDALALGRRIYAEKPRIFVQRLKRAWKAWQHHHRLPGRAPFLTPKTERAAA